MQKRLLKGKRAKTTATENARYPIIDLMRFTAIALMVFFHFFYDLDQFRFVDINFRRDIFWSQLPIVIITLFMLCVGMGLALNHQGGIRWRRVARRFVQLAFWAALISLVTYLAFPKRWIYFGTLHCIAFSSVLALPLLRYPRMALAIGLVMQVCYWGLKLRFPSLSKYLGIVSMDYIPLHPWLGVVLIGIFLHSCQFHRWQGHYTLPRWVTWASRYSLRIYLFHQIFLYGLVFSVHKLLSR